MLLGRADLSTAGCQDKHVVSILELTCWHMQWPLLPCSCSSQESTETGAVFLSRSNYPTPSHKHDRCSSTRQLCPPHSSVGCRAPTLNGSPLAPPSTSIARNCCCASDVPNGRSAAVAPLSAHAPQQASSVSYPTPAVVYARLALPHTECQHTGFSSKHSPQLA